MQDVTLDLQKRDIIGKAVKGLRTQGMVPAVIHNHGQESIVVAAPYIEIVKAYQRVGRHHPIELKAGNKKFTALIKSVARDPKKNKLTHVVFNAVKADQMVDAAIPVKIKHAEGQESTPAERVGLVVLHQLEEVEIEALPKDLPEVIYFDGEKLVEAGQSVTVADLIVPSNVTVKSDPAHPVATVFEPSALQAANEAAAGDAEEEVVAEGGEAEAVEPKDGTDASAGKAEPGGNEEK